MTQEHPSNNPALDAYIREQMDAQHIPGLSVAVVRDGAVLVTRGYGYANLELNVPATSETVYQIGSLTKQFTAVAVMMLVQEGMVGLDDPITRYLDHLPGAWGGVTVRNLLNHTSGIKSFTDFPDLMQRWIQPTTREEILALVGGDPLAFAPGERFAYCNTGYFLLGHVIERAASMYYGEFLQQRIFTPLGMNTTCVNDMSHIIPNRASGYEWAEDRWANAPHVSMTWAFSAGALVSTVTDLACWDLALSSERLLPTAAWEQMWTRTPLTDGTSADYGFGWFVLDYQGHQAISHSGGIPGFLTIAERYPDDGLTVILLTNLYPCKAGSILRGIAGHYVPSLMPTPATTDGG